MKKNNKNRKIFFRTLQPFFTLIVLLLVSGFGDDIMASDNMKFKLIGDVSIEDWEKLANSKIFFGHHSVGNNIINGTIELQKEHPEIMLNIIKTHDASQFSSPAFAHSPVGNNTDPDSKIKEFDAFIRNGIGLNADIAFFKFCFVDIVRRTDVHKLFKEYKAVISKIQHDYPEISILHCTVPLQVHKLTWKTVVKNIINFTSWKYTDNIRRNQFNNLLREEYGKSGKLFDLALLEATCPDGSIVSYLGPKGKKFFGLNPAYSSDGAHLNTTGAKIIAKHLLCFLLNETALRALK